VAADIAVTGPISRPLIKGQIRVIRADVRAPDRLPPSVIDLNVVEVGSSRTLAKADGAAATAAPSAGTGFSAELDVTVIAPGQILVRGRGLNAEFAGEVTASGTTAALRLSGRLTLVRGQLDLLGKTFQFTRANITFLGGPRLDPELDLLANVNATGISAEVTVTGTATQPKISLTSTPVLPQDEILAHVLFDKPVAQLSPLEAVQLAQSAAELSGLHLTTGSGLLETIRRAVGLDRLAMVGGSGTGQASGVEAGQYLTNNVYVGVHRGAAAGSGGATVQVDLTKSLTAVAQVNANRDSRIGVRFEVDY
jgi:translocation and assembly module TamB